MSDARSICTKSLYKNWVYLAFFLEKKKVKGFFTCELWYYSSDNFVPRISIAGHINLYIVCILCDCFAKRISKTSGTFLWIFQIQILHYSGCWGVCFGSPFTFICTIEYSINSWETYMTCFEDSMMYWCVTCALITNRRRVDYARDGLN